jgi:hypothetical protein
MSLTVANMYSVRFGTKLHLPELVQDNIARLRITAAAYKPVRHAPRHHAKHQPKYDTSDNWRMKSLEGFVSKIKNKDDPDYNRIFEILNKVSVSNMEALSKEASAVLAKRDPEFRLRATTLLFDKAIRESLYANIMADVAAKLNTVNPDIQDDLRLQAQMFPKLYDINTTLTYPTAADSDFDNKVILWMKQKETRRGYARFLTQLYIRDMLTDEIMIQAVDQVVSELRAMAQMPKTEQTDENTTQFVDFLFESSKILPVKSKAVRERIASSLKEVLAIPRTDVPSLGMRSRFRLEDALKNVQ